MKRVFGHCSMAQPHLSCHCALPLFMAVAGRDAESVCGQVQDNAKEALRKSLRAGQLKVGP